MRKIKVWNKKDKINGIEADYVINSHKIKDEDEIFLVMNEDDIVSEIQFKKIIARHYNLDANLTCEEVAQKYLEIKQQEEQKQQQEIDNKLTQQEEIERLKQENASISYILMKNDLL